MALVVGDRVQETTATSGTGTLSLAGAVSGYQTFVSGIGSGNTTFYTIYDQTAQVWEVGIGTVTSGSPATLSRDTVLSNSSGNTSPINLAGNSTSVFCVYPAEKSVNLDASGNVSPLGTVSSGTWQGTTVGVSYGGTGVTASSGANSVVLRDANQNISVNSVTQALTSTTASGGTTTLTTASPHFQVLSGTGAHTFKLPDATTLPVGSAWIFDNDSTGNLTVTDYAGDTVDVVSPGGYSTVFMEVDGTVAGTWGRFGMIPSEVNWGTNSLDLGGSTVISNGVWQGTPVASNYGGTGLTTFSAANYALYSTSASALTAGTLPVAAGGTGATTLTGYVYGNGTGAMTASTSIPNSATTATSANTASAIVARDASGNFSAGTITASMSTAVTFNNGGTGDASGTTYNGGTARTISYNSVGASPLAGSSSLTTTGTVTSGTWSASFGAVSGANLTNLTAGNLSGTIPSAVLGNSTAYVGTTAVALNRASANQALTGITSVAFPGATSGTATVQATAVAGTPTLSLPTTTGTLALTSDIPTVNNGTLTLGVSGTGLSGSATFTANQSGNSTFTVTSNATNANTASTIVARDASGNFSAGTITAALSGNATTATTASALTTGNSYQVNSLGVGTAASGTAGEIRATNNITAYYSDGRLKHRLGKIENALDKVDSLTGFLYRNNEIAAQYGYTNTETQVGLDANDVKRVQPEATAPAPFDIGQREDGTEYSKSGQDYLTVRYERLIPLLVEAIKELRVELTDVKARLP